MSEMWLCWTDYIGQRLCDTSTYVYYCDRINVEKMFASLPIFPTALRAYSLWSQLTSAQE